MPPCLGASLPLFVGAAGSAVSPSPVVCAGEEGAEGVAEGGEAASRDVAADGEASGGGRPVSIRWRKARWYCTELACPRGSFTEAMGQVPPRMRTTEALRQAAGATVCDGGRMVVRAGRDLGLSWPIVRHCLEDYAATVLPETPPVTSAIGIDETRRGKPVWKQNPDTGKWEVPGRGRLAHRIRRRDQRTGPVGPGRGPQRRLGRRVAQRPARLLA